MDAFDIATLLLRIALVALLYLFLFSVMRMATRGLEPAFDVFDEVYQFKRFDPDRVHVLLALERNPETGAPGSFPLAWTRETGRGRVFYTALGHRPDVIAAPWYRAHLRGGILWALGQS